MKFGELRPKPTRFEGLAYDFICPGVWMFLDVLGQPPAQIGRQYASKAEMLADVERFAAERGFQLRELPAGRDRTSRFLHRQRRRAKVS